MKRIGILAVVLTAAATAGWWLTRPAPIAVRVVTAERGMVLQTVSNTRAGTVDACRRAQLSPPMGGQIARLPVADGDHVKRGQLLLELWNDDLMAERQLAMREAAAAASRARETCVLADVAEREAARLTTLRERQLVSDEAADQAVGRAQAGRAACDAATDATGVAEARVTVIAAQLERTQLKAPFDGVIAEINGELGEFVTPSPVGIPTPPTVDLIDATCLYISAPIDEVDAPRIARGMPARISLDAFPNRSFPGHVRRVAPYVLDLERQARTVEIEAEIDADDKSGLLPGYSADVEVVIDERHHVLRVPSSVILPDGSVYVLDTAAGRIERRAIERGLSNWEYTEILTGLHEGDQVVSSIDREGIRDGAAARPEQTP